MLTLFLYLLSFWSDFLSSQFGSSKREHIRNKGKSTNLATILIAPK